MNVARVVLIAIRVAGVLGIVWMAITGKQRGGKKLHMAYRLMVLLIFAALIGAYLLVR